MSAVGQILNHALRHERVAYLMQVTVLVTAQQGRLQGRFHQVPVEVPARRLARINVEPMPAPTCVTEKHVSEARTLSVVDRMYYRLVTHAH
jgi:hypothetical protein